MCMSWHAASMESLASRSLSHTPDRSSWGGSVGGGRAAAAAAATAFRLRLRGCVPDAAARARQLGRVSWWWSSSSSKAVAATATVPPASRGCQRGLTPSSRPTSAAENSSTAAAASARRISRMAGALAAMRRVGRGRRTAVEGAAAAATPTAGAGRSHLLLLPLIL